MNRLLSKFLLVLLTLIPFVSALAQADEWPRTLPLEQGLITVYAPQVDEMSGGVIKFRAALAYRETADSEPVFGAGWFESPVNIDRSARMVYPTNLVVTETRFPAGTDDVQAELSAALAQEAAVRNLDFSLDEVEASLATSEAESRALQQLNTDPPRIIYRDHPALLVSLDGEPVIREIENSQYTAVINTTYPLISDGKYYYLNVANNVWYRARKATGPYQFEGNPPAGIADLVKDDETEVQSSTDVVTAANAPEIVVSTEPAELIVTEGPAAFVPLVDDLLVLQNSDDDVFMHVSAQKYYIVLAGRWYESGSLAGPWAYRAADDLPAAFANIPADSDQADSRVYVAGTQEAREAVLDAQVPQTAAVARGEVDIDVQYDGDPNFEAVDGADLTYANNTGSSVIEANGMYYLVEDGVWYVSSTPDGPWLVSDHRPQQVVSIQPTSPVHNVKYVYVYDSTPDVVYVGYTPGYYGSYVYQNTLFYGSGYYYDPWVSPYYYYPRHSTWGFNVSYNSWSGWNFGLSWGWGPFSVGFYTGGYWHHQQYWHHNHYGRWGPGRYRPRPYHRGRNGHHRPGREHYASNNLYRGDRQRARIDNTRDVRPARNGVKQKQLRKNNVKYARSGPVKASALKTKAMVRDVNHKASRSRLLADNNGNVYRKSVDSRMDKRTVNKRPAKKSSTVTKTTQRSKVTQRSAAGDRVRSQKPQSRSTSKRSNGQSKRPASTPVQKQSGTRTAQKQSGVRTVQKQSGARTVQKQSGARTVQKQSGVRTAQKQSGARTVQKQSKPRVVQQQSKPRVVQQQSKPRVVHQQSRSQTIQQQSRPQRVQQQSYAQVRQAPQQSRQAPQQSRQKAVGSHQKSNGGGGNRVKAASSKPRSRKH